MAGTTSQPEQNWWEIKTPPLALFLFLLLSSALGGGTRHPRGNLSTIGETDRITGTIPFYHAPVHKRVKLSTHTGLSDNDIRGNQSDREMRCTAQRPNLRSVFFFFVTETTALDTTPQQIKQLPEHPCGILIEIIHSAETQSGKKILSWLGLKSKLNSG